MLQDNGALVDAFKMCLNDAHFDTLRDMAQFDDTRHIRLNIVCGRRISDDRLGQVLRAVKAMNA